MNTDFDWLMNEMSRLVVLVETCEKVHERAIHCDKMRGLIAQLKRLKDAKQS